MKYLIERVDDGQNFRVTEFEGTFGIPAERIRLVTAASQPGSHMSIERVIRNLFPVEPPSVEHLIMGTSGSSRLTACGKELPRDRVFNTAANVRCSECDTIARTQVWST